MRVVRTEEGTSDNVDTEVANRVSLSVSSRMLQFTHVAIG
jgi:hypothetical protein